MTPFLSRVIPPSVKVAKGLPLTDIQPSHSQVQEATTPQSKLLCWAVRMSKSKTERSTALSDQLNSM